ncbi:hypothetical protein [uncultured Maribacter sp.]|uniref:hypothetical protein n=1 Tax=uncultured Maribacter sp. TaxID=431308 RepID=UPI0030D7D5F3
MTNDVEYTYSLKNDILFLTIHLDLLKWNGDYVLYSLNKECYDPHKGVDGVSKL